jgi:GNAT superfamily N-acetyltransferase
MSEYTLRGQAIEVRREEISSAVAQALILALNVELSETYPEEGATHFRLDPEEVADGRGAFLVAYADGRPVGCGAIRRIDADSGEIKRMYVERSARGRGIGRLLLTALEVEGQRLGVKRIVLETGVRQREALALYSKAGFSPIPAYGEYVGSPLSVCMGKALGPSIEGIHFREATAADAAAMAQCRLSDPAGGPADPRMAAYFDGRHHPQQALLPRVGYVALTGDTVVGYIAGHRTTRYACAGELQYLYVASAYRRRGIASALLRLLARWFQEQGAARVCVNVNLESPPAQPFYVSQAASALNKYWYVWEDIGVVLENESV